MCSTRIYSTVVIVHSFAEALELEKMKGQIQYPNWTLQNTCVIKIGNVGNNRKENI